MISRREDKELEQLLLSQCAYACFCINFNY